MGHILGPKSHVSIASLLRLLLAMVMEIWYRECGPFMPNFAVLAILGHIGNTMSSWGKGPSREGRAILVAYDQWSIALGFRIYSSGLVRDMQYTAIALSPNFAYLVVLCSIGEHHRVNVTTSRTPMHGIKGSIKARELRLGSTRSPRKPTLVSRPRRPNLPMLAS